MFDVATEDQSHREGRFFRPVMGLIVLFTAIGGFAALFVVRVPIENKDAMMFALGSVFGWAASVVASEYGSTATGRKVAESAIRKYERQDIAAEAGPSGTATDPTKVEVVNKPDAPANVRETSE